MRWADEHDVTAWLIRATCPKDLTLQRLTARAAADDDVSDAGPAIYASSSAGFEQTDEWPDERSFTISTASDTWRDDLANRLGRWGIGLRTAE